MSTLLGRVAIAGVLSGALAVGGVVAVNHYIDARLDDIHRVTLTTAPPGPNGANFLIVGSDSRAFVSDAEDRAAFGTESDTGPARSDTLMVLHAQGVHSFVVSFPRDLWVDLPGRGKGKINAAFNDGPQKVIDTFTQNFSIPINHYLEVDFSTFRGIVNAIGSVPVWFPAPARDDLTGLSIPSAGCVALDGPDTLAYVRSRHLEYEDVATGKWHSADAIPDIGRIARQQDFIRELGSLAVRRSLRDPRVAPDVVTQVLHDLKADDGFDRTALNELVRSFLGLDASFGGKLEFLTLPWTVGHEADQDVLFPEQPDAGQVLARDCGRSMRPRPRRGQRQRRIRVTSTSGCSTGPA